MTTEKGNSGEPFKTQKKQFRCEYFIIPLATLREAEMIRVLKTNWKHPVAPWDKTWMIGITSPNVSTTELTSGITLETAKWIMKEVNRALERSKEKPKPDLFELVKSNKHQELQEALNEHSYDLNVQDQNGQTSLILAALWRHKNCLQLLLESGVDPNARSKQGETALLWAAREGHEKCLEILLEYGADPNIRNPRGKTALELAAHYNNNTECIQLLLENGATVSPELKEKYPQYSDLWSKAVLKPILESVSNIKEQLACLEASINDLQ